MKSDVLTEKEQNAVLDYLKGIQYRAVSEFGYFTLQNDKVVGHNHEYTVCHAQMKYWNKNGWGDNTYFYTKFHAKPFDWQEFLVSEHSPYAEVLSQYCITEIDFLKEGRAYVFPKIRDLPTRFLYNFCIATRVPWDDAPSCYPDFKHWLEEGLDPNLAAFLSLGYREQRKGILREALGYGHAPLSSLPSELFYPRWRAKKPNLTKNTYGNNPEWTNCSQTTWATYKGEAAFWGAERLLPGAYTNLKLSELVKRLSQIEKEYPV